MASNKKRKTVAVEFCKVCNRHHQDKNRHKYFPKHLASLSSFLSKFQSKLSDVHFFLKNPTILLPQHASRNRLWCVFCDVDVQEIGSSFACSKAISHLASVSHLKCLKSFLWKNGGLMDQVASFVISEYELAKWKSKCDMLRKGSVEAGEGLLNGRDVYGPSSSDIQHQSAVDSLNNYTMNTLELNNSNDVVMPLHRYTNENYQVWASGMEQNVGFDHGYHQDGVASAFQLVPLSDARSTGIMRNSGFQSHQQIPSVLEEAVGNVHTGAPPPWLETISSQDTVVKGSEGDHFKTASQKNRKLNPKRVGAAWADKRRMEIEMEKKGEVSTGKIDDSWLPNFGSVWQTGSRKVSKKEFKLERQKVFEVSGPSDMHIEIRPYVSKKTRADGTSMS